MLVFFKKAAQFSKKKPDEPCIPKKAAQLREEPFTSLVIVENKGKQSQKPYIRERQGGEWNVGE
jgi:hypothetical protein